MLAGLSLACSPGRAGEGMTGTGTGEVDATDTDNGPPTGDGDTDPDTGTPTTGEDTGSTNGGDTGSGTDTDGASILCPLIHQSVHIDADALPDTVLDSQDDVAVLAGCTDISGSLRIGSAVTDLAPLASLRRIAGSLYINDRSSRWRACTTSSTSAAR